MYFCYRFLILQLVKRRMLFQQKMCCSDGPENPLPNIQELKYKTLPPPGGTDLHSMPLSIEIGKPTFHLKKKMNWYERYLESSSLLNNTIQGNPTISFQNNVCRNNRGRKRGGYLSLQALPECLSDGEIEQIGDISFFILGMFEIF